MRMRFLRTLLLICAAAAWAGRPVPAAAQTPFVPYFFQIPPHYDRFDWHIYKTDHFDIWYYPSVEPHLERVASYAESAYQHISADLKHDLAQRVPLIVFKTSSEFQENNVFGGETPEGVLAFAEPERNRLLLPLDLAPDQLYDLITHELTHIFEFDIIPRGLISASLPLWVDEGLADYMTGSWNVLDLVQVRDAALTDNVPKMSHFESQPLTTRLPYSMGHAAFEFIEARWGKEGVRNFLFSLRKNVLGSGETAYEEALKLKADEFDDQFDRYIKDRFKPFRDKERPADYGRNLAPSPEKTPYVDTVSIEPSPSGDILAAFVANVHDQEYDIILLSARDGQFIRNLTKGFDKDRGFERIERPGGFRGNLVPLIAWAPVGDHLAYFVRTEKDESLIIQNVVSGKTERRLKLKEVNNPESPVFTPDGKSVAFSAIQNGVTDIFVVDLASGALRNLTKDATADYAPAFAPDGKSMVYTGRIGTSDKLFRLDVATGVKTQLTFGSHDDTGAKFYDDHTLVFTSTAIDPAITLAPDVARNGNIPNVWTLDLNTKQLQQWTDTATGNVSPVVLRQTGALKVAFVTYYKGENGIHTVTGDKPIATVATDDFGGPGPIFEFTAPISHTLVPDNIHKKRPFEKMTMIGRPPLNVGVTNSGTIYGDTQITFADVLGDKQISFYAQSVAQYRTTAFTYVNLERRLQYALQGFSQDLFYYGQNEGALYDPSLAPFITRDLAESVQTQRGGTAFAIYPFNRRSRVEISSGYIYLNERYTNSAVQAAAEQYQIDQYGASLLRQGHMIPFEASFINETTVYREYGPLAGRAVKLSFNTSPDFGSKWISRNTLDIDARHYTRIAANGVFAVRLKAMKSWGRNPDYMYYGGNSEMRGYEYLEFLGNKGFFADAELRFPLVEAMLTPFGVIGGLRGVFFGNLGATGFNTQPFRVATRGDEIVSPLAGYTLNDDGSVTPRYGSPFVMSGLRLLDGRASYGLGLETFVLGFPMHFDWSWKTLFNKTWEDYLFPSCTQTSQTNVDCHPDGNQFRKMKFDFWIGYDF